MRISDIEAAEHDRATEVWEAAVRATHDFVTEADIDELRPMVRSSFGTINKLAGLRDDNDQLVGFVGVEGDNIGMLFLDPAVHGQGGGRLLLQHALTEFGARKVDVNEQNPQAVGFYLHEGFVVRSRSPYDDLGKPYPLLHLELPD